jgi:two-component system cell cycle sensor histidine kinase/response regulator CckA
MKKPLRILLLEDNPDDAALVVRELHQSGLDFDWVRVETESAFSAALTPPLPDLILSDYSLPQFNGLRAVQLLRELGLDIPFILISGTVGEDIAVEAMKHGATDYLLKDRTVRLGNAVRRALEEKELRDERKRLEVQFIEAQKMEVIGQLAAGVAHDFNNLLAVIMGYSDLMLKEMGSDHRFSKSTEEILNAAERGVALTRQLLVFSRKQTVQPSVLDLNIVVEDMRKMLGRLIDENVELHYALSGDLGRIQADSGHVGQVIMNFVVNARDAMPNGGKITIATTNITLDEHYAATHTDVEPGRYVMLSVSDTGTGMGPEIQARLFEPFFTTKPAGKGTGLGLTTCQTIARQSGGHIGVYSEPGRGTTMKAYFPRVNLPLDTSTEFFKKTPLPRGTETILLVEDEPALRQLAQSILEAQGYNVLRAGNGQEGLTVARQHQGAPIRLVVTDVVMPQMGGNVMAERLKTIVPGVKVLFTSGYTDDAIAQHGVLEQGVAFLAKPFTPAMLTRKVRELLDGPR